MASKREYRVHAVSDLAGYDSQATGIYDHSFSGHLILGEFSRPSKAIKQVLVIPANLQDVTICLNTADQSGDAYVVSGCPFKKFNRLLLFPFHCFW